MTSPRPPKHPSPAAPTSIFTTVAWVSMLITAGLMPIVVALGQGLAVGFADEPYHLPKLVLLAVGLSVASIAWLADIVVSHKELRFGTALIPAGVFAVLIGVSTIVSPTPLSSLFGAIGLSTGAITWLLCIWWLFLTTQYLESPARIAQLSWALIAGCAAAALVALLGAVGADPLKTPFAPDTGWMVGQGMGTTGNPNFTGLLLVVPIVVAIGVAVQAKTKLLKSIAFGAAAFMGVALVITLARAAAVGAVIALAIFAIVQGKKLFASRVSVIATVVALLAVAGIGIRISTVRNVLERISTGGGATAASSGRIPLWRDAIAIIARHPIFGTGPDQLAIGGYEVQAHPLIVGTQRFVMQDPHSLPLFVAAVLGIPALIALIVLVVMALIPAVKTALSKSAGNQLYVAWLAAFLGFGAALLISVWTITSMFVFFTALAVLLAPHLTPRSPKIAPVVVLAAVAVPLLAVSVFGASRSLAASHEIMLSNTDDPPTHYAKAIALAPWDANTRIKYYVRKIYAYQSVIAGPDAAASINMVDGIDTELRFEIERFPNELLFYRLRFFLMRMPEGSPGYRPEKLREVLQQATEKFPVDPEFKDALAKLSRGSGAAQPASGN